MKRCKGAILIAPSPKRLWRVGDFFLACAVGVLLLGLYQTKAQDSKAEAKGGHGQKVVPFAERGPFKAAYPENARFIDRLGRLFCLYEELGVYKEHRFAFKPRAEERYFVVLENKKCEELEKLSQDGRLEVRVSGTLTLYRGVNYLLVTRVSPK